MNPLVALLAGWFGLNALAGAVMLWRAWVTRHDPVRLDAHEYMDWVRSQR